MGSKGTTTELNQFVEDMGILLEKSRVPRMAGKIFGYLLVSEKSEVSTDELVGELQASRGSVSTMTRLLIQMGLVERVGRPAERRDFFRVKSETWSSILNARLEQIIELHEFIERGMSLVTAKNPLAYNRLREMHEFYEFFEREFPALFERWEGYQKQSGRK
ncbi:MAG: MarR family transcriptional regulator [Ignavibacteria bacterium]|nr:MarR family transcriptional regulator [Ignavibacteria bacterium]